MNNGHLQFIRDRDYINSFYKTLGPFLDENGKQISGAHGNLHLLQGTEEYIKKKITQDDHQRLIKGFLSDLAYFMQLQRRQISSQYFLRYKNIYMLHEKHNSYEIILQKCDYDLFDFIQKFKDYPDLKNIKISIALQLIEAVHELHTNKLIHGDLKSLNVLLKNFRVKITDFESMYHNDSMRLSFVGTIEYCSKQKIDCFSNCFENSYKFDIYSLGLIIYEIFEGILPYEIQESVPKKKPKTPSQKQKSSPGQRVQSLLQQWNQMQEKIKSQLIFKTLTQQEKDIISLIQFILRKNTPSSEQIVNRKEFIQLKQGLEDTQYKLRSRQDYQKQEAEKISQQHIKTLEIVQNQQSTIHFQQERIKQQMKKQQDKLTQLKISMLGHNIISKTSRNERTIAQLFFDLDKNKNGLIDRNQFKAIFLKTNTKKQINEKIINEIFDYLDADSSNQIDSAELMGLFHGILQMKSIKRIQQFYEKKIQTYLFHNCMAALLSNADKKNNGQINLKDVKNLVTTSYSSKKIKNILKDMLSNLEKSSCKKMINSRELVKRLNSILPEEVNKKIGEAYKIHLQNKQNLNHN